jgi:hypothetical protein
MAKQSFSTGQVLTAAQMTSLQQTAMGGGSPSTKTASYVLVAADAGTVIQMNSASATTVTVNTSLFAAGDSVQIQNIGAGTMTITAGTATVNSAGSLGVTQYDGGFLYFSSASSAIWFDYTQAGTTLPLTTKGDLFGYSTTNARVPIGTNGQVLTADSTEALGLKWATAASGGMTVIATTTFNNTASTYTYSSLGSYKHLYIVGQGLTHATTGTGNIEIQYNSDSGGNYDRIAFGTSTASFEASQGQGTTSNWLSFRAFAANTDATLDYGTFTSWIPNYGGSGYKSINSTTMSYVSGSSARANTSIGTWNNTSAITSITITANTANFNTGILTVYGVS